MLEWTFKLFDMIVLKRSKTLQTAHNKETGAWFSAGSPGGYSWEFLVGVCRLVLQILTLLQTKKCRVDIHTCFQTTSKIHTRFQTWPLGSNYVMITYNRAQTKNLFKCISNLYISISFLFIWNWNDNYVHTGSRSSFEKRTRFHTPGQSLYPFSDPTAQKPYPLGRHIPTWLTYRSFQHPALMWYWLFDSYFFYKLPLITSSTLQEIFDVFRFTFLSFSAKALRNTVFYIFNKLYLGLFQWAPEQVNIKRPSSPLPRGFVYYNKTVFHYLWLCTMTWWML